MGLIGYENNMRLLKKSDKGRKSYTSNFIYSILSKAISAIALVAFDALIARKLGIDDYGEWVFFFSIMTMFFYIGWLGINSATKVFVAKCSSDSESNKIINESIKIRFYASLIFAVISCVILFFISHFFKIDSKYIHLKGLLSWSIIIVFINSLTEYFKELLIGLKKYRYLFILSCSEYLGYLICTAIVLMGNKGVYSVAEGYMCGGIMALVFGVILIHKSTGYSFQYRKKTDNRLAKNIAKYAIPLAIMGVGSVILIEMDTFLLGVLSAKIETATYSIGKNLCSKLAHINYALATALLPSIAVNIEKGGISKKEFKKYEHINSFISIVVFAGIIIFANIYISIIYGKQYSMAIINVRMLAPYYLMTGVSAFYAQFMDYTGKARARVVAYSIMIIINFVLDFLLIPLWGAIGASIATDIALVPYAVLTFLGTKQRIDRLEK